jgi:hypothetical protein
LNNGKKQKINVDKWKDKKRKESRNAGMPFISLKEACSREIATNRD